MWLLCNNSFVKNEITLHKTDTLHLIFYIVLHFYTQPASWSSGQSFWLLIMVSGVWFPVLPLEFFLEGEDPHGDHGLGSLTELRFKAPPGTSYS
jgi:hypothetical protein